MEKKSLTAIGERERERESFGGAEQKRWGASEVLRKPNWERLVSF